MTHFADAAPPAAGGGEGGSVQVETQTPTHLRVREALAVLAERRAQRQGVSAAGYQDLSKWYAAGGRMDCSALAMWAQDLRVTRTGIGAALEGFDGAVEGQVGDDPYGSLDRSRVLLLDALFANGVRVSDMPELPSPAHIGEVMNSTSRPVTGVGEYDDLIGVAEHLMQRAALAPEGMEVARRDARRADLTALDAVLLSSAVRAGDVHGASVELRRALANTSLMPLEPQLRDLSLVEEVREVRVVLRNVVEPHEVIALNEAFAPEPA